MSRWLTQTLIDVTCSAIAKASETWACFVLSKTGQHHANTPNNRIAHNDIIGQWVKSSGAHKFADSLNSATGEQAAQFVTASLQEVDTANACAHTTLKTTTWSRQRTPTMTDSTTPATENTTARDFLEGLQETGICHLFFQFGYRQQGDGYAKVGAGAFTGTAHNKQSS